MTFRSRGIFKEFETSSRGIVEHSEFSFDFSRETFTNRRAKSVEGVGSKVGGEGVESAGQEFDSSNHMCLKKSINLLILGA